MQMFFAQVERVEPRDDEHDPIHWVGKKYRKITDPSQLNHFLVPFATLTEEHIEQLWQAQAESEFAVILQIIPEDDVPS